MCGIAGFIIKDPSMDIDREALLDALLHLIDNRGGDACGFVARNREGIVEWHKASCDARGFVPFRRRLPAATDVVVAHTRMATNGHPAFPENNHPVKRGPIFVTHNGIVYNDAELFRATDRTPYGQVDSEAIAALLAHADTLSERVGPLFGAIDGSAAIAAMDERDGTVLLARIDGSPLYVLTTRRVVIWASTPTACETAHKVVIGSLGKNRARHMLEGDALIYTEGKARSFTFDPPRFTWRAPTPIGNETTGSYLPAKGAIDRCELCNEALTDTYDLWDEGDVYEVCAPCFDTFAHDVRSSYRERLERLSDEEVARVTA